MKMSDYQKGEWQVVWDGLFWHFMDKHRAFFLKNPRLGMLVRTFDKMSEDKKQEHLKKAFNYLNSLWVLSPLVTQSKYYFYQLTWVNLFLHLIKKHKMDLKNIQTEIDASYLYKQLSTAEKDPNVSHVFAQMSEIEFSHALAFAKKFNLKIENLPKPSIALIYHCFILFIFKFVYFCFKFLDCFSK